MHKSDLIGSNSNNLYNSDRVPLIHLDQLPKILICKFLIDSNIRQSFDWNKNAGTVFRLTLTLSFLKNCIKMFNKNMIRLFICLWFPILFDRLKSATKLLQAIGIIFIDSFNLFNVQ